MKDAYHLAYVLNQSFSVPTKLQIPKNILSKTEHEPFIHLSRILKVDMDQQRFICKCTMVSYYAIAAFDTGFTHVTQTPLIYYLSCSHSQLLPSSVSEPLQYFANMSLEWFQVLQAQFLQLFRYQIFAPQIRCNEVLLRRRWVM